MPTVTCEPCSPSLLYRAPRSRRRTNGHGSKYLIVRAYMEESSSISGFANKVISLLLVIRLVARIFGDGGVVGSNIVDFAGFRRRVGNKCSVNDSQAFFKFQDQHGKVTD